MTKRIKNKYNDYCLEDDEFMDSRLRKVVHIEVFDYEGEMVLGEQSQDPFSYTYQQEYYIGDRRIGKTHYNSNVKRKISMGKTRLQELKKKADKVLNKAFSYVEGKDMIDVAISGGSSIIYRGNQKEEFLEKVLTMKKT